MESGESDGWIRRVGLYGTHNNKQFEVTGTELRADINEGADDECRVVVTHRARVAHREAVFWFPLSDLRGAKGFAVDLNGERLRGTIQLAVSQADVQPLRHGTPQQAGKLYYYRALCQDELGDVPREGTVELKISFTMHLMPVAVGDDKRYPCFMCPIAACFPRGVDTALIHVTMRDTIRAICCVDPRDNIYPHITYDEAVVRFDTGKAISPDTDLFILRIETGPRILREFDTCSILLLIFVVVLGVVLHNVSAHEVDTEAIFS
eukprot:TRINITY_DN13712_c0_g1_i1.p1 TRINITY_DN13712_c0_g1~~TRINITY_DN13712_c0_g1_i1.p1  ORF type:complete len:264 (+),score=86.01 TRINITY_DN13712_c0_g1_i1:136-927(+)